MARFGQADPRWSRPGLLLGAGLVLALILIYDQVHTSRLLLEQLVVAQQRSVREASAHPGGAQLPVAGAAASSRVGAATEPRTRAVKPIPQLASRYEIPQLLQDEGLRTGAELGVLFGDFAEHHLNIWTGCTKYYLVDLWGKQENYVDLANAEDSEQEKRYTGTQKRLDKHSSKTEFLRMYTTEGAKQIPDDSLDYVYVDARHDYCGVMEDLQAYWPKLKSGGIFAGHDYLDADDQALKDTNQDWSVCGDGTVNRGAVKGAVDEFAATHGLTVVVTTGDEPWRTWLARKP